MRTHRATHKQCARTIAQFDGETQQAFALSLLSCLVPEFVEDLIISADDVNVAVAFPYRSHQQNARAVQQLRAAGIATASSITRGRACGWSPAKLRARIPTIPPSQDDRSWLELLLE